MRKRSQDPGGQASDGRHFEIAAAAIVSATLSKLARDGKFDPKKAAKAIADLEIDPEKIDPAIA